MDTSYSWATFLLCLSNLVCPRLLYTAAKRIDLGTVPHHFHRLVVIEPNAVGAPLDQPHLFNAQKRVSANRTRSAVYGIQHDETKKASISKPVANNFNAGRAAPSFGFRDA